MIRTSEAFWVTTLKDGDTIRQIGKTMEGTCLVEGDQQLSFGLM